MGQAVFSAEDAEAWRSSGLPVVLVRRETSPEDVKGMYRWASRGRAGVQGGGRRGKGDVAGGRQGHVQVGLCRVGRGNNILHMASK